MGAKPKNRQKNDPVVVAKNLEKSFGDISILNNINLTISKKEMVGIVGPNGGGKSTLLMLLAGLLRPTGGSVTVCDIEAYTLSLTSAGLVGLVTARPGLYPLLTGRENLHHFGGLFGLSVTAIDEHITPLAQTLQIDHALDERTGRLSTGMQQKISLIRALLLSPKLLLFDEPTANLDPIASFALMTEVRKRTNDGLACVLVTHDLPAAESVCDRVLIINGDIKKEMRFFEKRATHQGPLLSAWQKAISN